MNGDVSAEGGREKDRVATKHAEGDDCPRVLGRMVKTLEMNIDSVEDVILKESWKRE